MSLRNSNWLARNSCQMTPFMIHYRVARWSFTILPISPFPPSFTSLTSISPLLFFIPYIDWIVQRKRYGQKNGCSFRLYERDIHAVLPIPDCSVHHTYINLAVATADEQIATYDEDIGDGGLSYIQLQVERDTGEYVYLWYVTPIQSRDVSLSYRGGWEEVVVVVMI